MKVEVTQHPTTGKPDNIEWVGVVYQNEEVIILHIDLKSKGAWLSHGGGDDGVTWLWVGGDQIAITLPEDFQKDVCWSWQESKYSIFITIIKRRNVKRLCEDGIADLILWDRTEQQIELDDIET